MPLEILLCGFGGAPIRCQRRKFPHHESFDIGLAGFLIIVICAYVADVRVREAHNLPRVAWIGENFLVASEGGIKNDFAATAGASSRCAAAKDSPVLERENRANCGGLVQCVLQRSSSRRRVDRRSRSERAEMIHGPVGEDGFAIYKLPRHGA